MEFSFNPRNVVDLLVEVYECYVSSSPTPEEIRMKDLIKGKKGVEYLIMYAGFLGILSSRVKIIFSKKHQFQAGGL